MKSFAHAAAEFANHKNKFFKQKLSIRY